MGKPEVSKPPKAEKPAVLPIQKAAPIKKAEPIPKIAPPDKEKPVPAPAAPPPEATAAFTEMERAFFGAATTHTDYTAVTLTSEFGHFKLYEYDNPSAPADKHLVVFFYNSLSKKGCYVHGRIARLYVDTLPSHTGIKDFPIRSESAAKGAPDDRIAYMSLSSRIRNHATNDVKQADYKSYIPAEESAMIAYTQEYKSEIPNVVFKNWKSVDVAKYANSRTLRYGGMPTQIMLHETAGRSNMKIDRVRKDGGTYLLPHFCINNTDDEGKGNIIQFVDIAERVNHIKGFTKDRSVGIEIVNTPFSSKKPKIDLKESTSGVCVKTSFSRYRELFIPLEFSEEADDDSFLLTIAKADLLNAAALEKVELGKSKTKVVSEADGVVTLINCKSPKFETLLSLLKMLHDSKQIDGLDIHAKEQHRSVVVVDQKTCFLFESAYKEGKRDVNHYAIDIRLPGIYIHGVTRNNHHDGYLPGLYVYLRLIGGLTPGGTLQRMVDLIAAGKTKKGSRKPFELTEVLTASRETDKKPSLVVPEKPDKITIKNYVEV